MAEESTRIDRIYFLIHPACWSMSEGRPSPEYLEQYKVRVQWFRAAYHRELRVMERQKDLMRSLGPNDAMVIYPVGQSAAMKDLIDTATGLLGDRCIVQQRGIKREPQVLHEMDQPIRHFLEAEPMEGRDEFWEVLPPHIHDDVRSEIDRTVQTHGHSWGPGGLKVISGNRTYADEIADEIAARRWQVDPAKVEALAFGEGFEQCALTWKSAVADHLGWAKPIENDYDLSVSGTPCLFDAEFTERIALDHDVRLFLWRKPNDLWLGFYCRCRGRTYEPMYRAQFAPGDAMIEVVNMKDEVLKPGETETVTMQDGKLALPVLSGLRLSSMDDTCYIVGCDQTYEQFRDMLASAALQPYTVAQVAAAAT